MSTGQGIRKWAGALGLKRGERVQRWKGDARVGGETERSVTKAEQESFEGGRGSQWGQMLSKH